MGSILSQFCLYSYLHVQYCLKIRKCTLKYNDISEMPTLEPAHLCQCIIIYCIRPDHFLEPPTSLSHYGSWRYKVSCNNSSVFSRCQDLWKLMIALSPQLMIDAIALMNNYCQFQQHEAKYRAITKRIVESVCLPALAATTPAKITSSTFMIMLMISKMRSL